jgi:hypothetical protein
LVTGVEADAAVSPSSVEAAPDPEEDASDAE